MANTFNSVASPQNAVLGTCNLAVVTACTTRGPTATASLAGANIVVALPTVSTDTKISKIVVKGISTAFTAATVVELVGVWDWDGTTAYLITEILTTAVTPSTTVASMEIVTTYDDFVLPAGHALYMSVSITTAAATTALQAKIHGASF